MAISPPPIDKRTFEQLLNHFRRRSRFYTPEWDFSCDDDAGAALLKMFLFLYGKVQRRLNKVPFKNKVAFLDMLGIDQLPAQSAETWVSFVLTNGAPANVTVPKGTEIAAKGTDVTGKEQEVVFRTERDISVSPAKLTNIVSVNASSDSIFLHAMKADELSAVTLFTGTNEQEHVFFIGHDDFLNLTAPAIISLEFSVATKAQGELTIKENPWFEWEYWNGVRWAKLGVKIEDSTRRFTRSGKISITKSQVGEIVATTIHGIESRWIRCRSREKLTPFTPVNLPEIDLIKLAVNPFESFEPDMIFANEAVLDVGVISLRMLPIDVGELRVYSASDYAGGSITIMYPTSEKTLENDDKIELENGNRYIIKTKITDECEVYQLNSFFTGDTANGSGNAVYTLINGNMVKIGQVISSSQGMNGQIVTVQLDGTVSRPIEEQKIYFDGEVGDNKVLKPFTIKKILSPNSDVCVVTTEDGSQASIDAELGDAVRLVTAIRGNGNSGNEQVTIRFIAGDDFEFPEGRLIYIGDLASRRIFKRVTLEIDVGVGTLVLQPLGGGTLGEPFFADDYLHLVPYALPYGKTPRIADCFYLASDEAFTKKNAEVTIKFYYKLFGEPPDSITAIIVWEYFNSESETWRRLKVVDGTRGFTYAPNADTIQSSDMSWVSGEVRFICPTDLGATKVNSEEKHWIRAKIVSGNFGEEIIYTEGEITIKNASGVDEKIKVIETSQGNIAYPIIEITKISYQSPSLVPQYCLTKNNADYQNHTIDVGKKGRLFNPFTILPEKFNSLFLGFDAKLESGPLRLLFDIEENSDDEADNLKITWSYWDGNQWQELKVTDGTDNLSKVGVIEFFGRKDFTKHERFDQYRYWLRAQYVEMPSSDTIKIKGVYLNTVSAFQSEAVDNEILGASNGTANQEFSTYRAPIISQEIWICESSLPDNDAIKEIKAYEGDDAITVIPEGKPDAGKVWIRWHEVQDFDDASTDSRFYTVDRRTGTIHFGDGQQGMIPPNVDNNVKAHYFHGGGIIGNVNADSFTGLKTSIPFVAEVENHFAADGGAESETLDSILVRGPYRLKHRNRAVSVEDFEWMAKHVSRKVARAHCIPNRDSDGNDQPGWISVIIIPETDTRPAKPTLQLMKVVSQGLQSVCSGTLVSSEHIHVCGADYINIKIVAMVVPKSMEQAATAEKTVLDALNKYIDPLTGGKTAKGWPFKHPVTQAEIYAVIEGVSDVDYVKSLKLFTMQYEYNSDGTIAKTINKIHKDSITINPWEMVVSDKHEVELVIPGNEQNLTNKLPQSLCEEVS